MVFRGDLIQKAREARGMNREQLAVDAGIGMTTVFRIETGRVDPRASAVGRIAKALELDLRTLWTEDG